MSTLGALLILAGIVLAFAALWGWLRDDYRRYHREHPRELRILDETHSHSGDFAEALRCRGGRMSPGAPAISTARLDAFREQR